MKISIIIPCRNESGHIREFLDSVLLQDVELKWQLEVLVADGLSDDGTRETLKSYMRTAPNVRMIDNPGRIVSSGLNAAIAASTGDIIIRMDAHTTYAPDYIFQCIQALQQSGADNVGGPWVARGHGPVGQAIAAAFQSPFCAGGGRARMRGFDGEVDTVYLGCWPREVFDRVGLFDTNLVRNQDDEFNFRLRRAGGRIWQSSLIRSWYTPRSSVTALFRQYLQYGYWKVAVMRKHAAVAAWRHLVPALFVASILAAALCLALSKSFSWAQMARISGIALATELGIYAAACVASAILLVRSLAPLSLLLMPIVIAVHHVAYGLGTIAGLIAPFYANSTKAPSAGMFTALTR